MKSILEVAKHQRLLTANRPHLRTIMPGLRLVFESIPPYPIIHKLAAILPKGGHVSPELPLQNARQERRTLFNYAYFTIALHFHNGISFSGN